MTTIAVIDFETTGISPGMGDRATEVAIVLIEDGQVVDRFQSLMNAGVRVNSFITQLTGITNEMLQAAPSAKQVMREAARFVDGRTLAALHQLPPAGRAHLAMADAEVAASLLLHMQHDLKTRHGCIAPDPALLMGLQRTSRHLVGGY